MRPYVLVYNLAGKNEMCVAEDLEMTDVARCCFSTTWRAQFGRRYVIGAIPHHYSKSRDETG